MKRDFTGPLEAYIDRLKSTLDKISREEINGFLNLLVDALEAGRNVFTLGNGGSAATASHMAVDFNKGLSWGKARRFRFLCLSDNLPTLTAYANDVSYEDVFVEPLKNFLESGDLVIAISGSGNSRNVVKAVEYANAHGAVTVGLTGYDGGLLRKTARHGVHVPIRDMQVTEDLHMVLDHLAYSVLGAYLPDEDSGANHG
ncbi:MAG TPA: SIS domain-containing protein [Spirochaetia bacterium]|nr:SIS domain-containing protein [Spirochaetales bacterium]HRY80919.1 SIS domain-containing protein [Spirochaetia bacterium]HRZ89526.1 SIS domain-containing protein [Spirochaetia bacterium]